MSYKVDLENHQNKNKKGRETENDIENNDQELLNLNEVEDCGAHQSIINEDDEDAYSDHENDTT